MAAGEEKILVSVRVRPLNEKEKTRNDGCDWECINNTTIICKYHNLPDRPSYTFDKVFGYECPTKQVYDDGAKEVALCVLAGINSSIFAYGQTSSGKTYTMSGITGFAMDDIFGYIEKHKQERQFTLKFSAMEIYNEAVRDLLCEDNNTPLRLLDDPERGTVVEKLREETLTDRNHLEELLSICETQRKIGETSLNEASSRSHQILRLTIESSGREFSQESSATLTASVCFVDLAGSERASQTLSAGSRLKEGCHINRSLLTLGTVIRKLSKGRNGHIPYRDSKLTRILQNSLGGNARTAIICTMSPARSHLEQSRNTLVFASCAKEVATNAQINLVVSEKALVKQLQRELARMENELKNLGPASDSASSSTSEFYALLKQKEELIAKMEEQIQELKWQRDVAQSQVENLLKSTVEDRSSSSSMDNRRRRRSYDSTDFDEPRMLNNLGKSNFYSPDEDGFLLEDTTPQFSGNDLCDNWEEMAQRTFQESEDACKEVRCIEVEAQEKSGEAERVKIQDSLEDFVEKKAEPLSAEQDYESFPADEKAENEAMESKKEDADSSIKLIDIELSLYAKIESEDELTEAKLVETKETEPYVEKEDMKMSWSGQTKEIERSSKKEDMEKNPLRGESEQYVEMVQVYEESDKDDNTYEALKEKVKEMQKTIEYFMSMQSVEQKQSPSFKIDDNTSPGDYFKTKRSRSCRENLLFTRASASGHFTCKTSNTSFDSDNTIDSQSLKHSDTDTSNSSFHEFISGLKEMAMQHQSTHELDTETKNMMQENRVDESVSGEITEFERQQIQIIELWEVCNVPLVHRTFFFLLFKGDPSDFVYMEVELRRLSFLKESPETVKRETGKALTREKEWLAKKIPKKFGKKQREEVYKKWGVELSSKQRSLQVTHNLWTNTKDLEHCNESASLVASLVGFVDSNMTPQEMFGLSFSPTTFNIKSSGWRFTDSFSRISFTGGL